MSKRIKMILAIMLIVFFCVGCGNKVDDLNTKIDEALSSDKITQEQLDEIFDCYEDLSDEEKDEISRYDEIKIYENVDIEKINEINDEIKNISSDTDFESLLELKEKIDALDEDLNEISLVDMDSFNEFFQLSDMEKSAVAACQCIKKSLKSSSSFELQSAKVINDLNGTTKYYLVKIEYSATNGFGARIDAESFQTISSDFENPWWGLAILGGNYESALECTPFIQYYLLHDEEPTEMDIDKIMYYIDEDVSQ